MNKRIEVWFAILCFFFPVCGFAQIGNPNQPFPPSGIAYPTTEAAIAAALTNAAGNVYEVHLPCGDISIHAPLTVTTGPMAIYGCSGGDLTNSLTTGITRLICVPPMTSSQDLFSIDGSLAAGGAKRLAGIRVYNLMLDGNGVCRYGFFMNSQDTTYLENVKPRGGLTASWMHVNSTGTTVINSQVNCNQTGGAGLVIDWGSAIFNAQALSFDTGGCNASPGIELWIGGGGNRTMNFNGTQMNINVATSVGFILITGYDTATSPWPRAGTALAGAPDTVNFISLDVLYGSNSPTPASQGADVLINGTATNQPARIYFRGSKFDATLASGGGQIAIKADNVKGGIVAEDTNSIGHTSGAACFFNITSNAFAPGASLFQDTISDTNRTCGTVTSALDVDYNFAAWRVRNGHILSAGPALSATNLSVCGTSPALVGTDNFGTITVGSAAGTGCVLTFGTAWGTAPSCVVSDDSAIVAIQPVSTTTTLTLTGSAALTGAKLTYACGSIS